MFINQGIKEKQRCQADVGNNIQVCAYEYRIYNLVTKECHRAEDIYKLWLEALKITLAIQGLQNR